MHFYQKVSQLARFLPLNNRGFPDFYKKKEEIQVGERHQGVKDR
jgi:hypothetical protein